LTLGDSSATDIRLRANSFGEISSGLVTRYGSKLFASMIVDVELRFEATKPPGWDIPENIIVRKPKPIISDAAVPMP
jgi:hypothetical protein